MKNKIEGVTKDGLFLFASAVVGIAAIVFLGFILWALILVVEFIGALFS